MTDMTMTTANEPDGAPRIGSLDILRGIAILGILFMNINDMGASLWASFGDFRQIGWTAADQVAWWMRQVIANGTARCMLEMLFGAGMVILTDRAAGAVQASVDSPTGRARRVARWLFGPAAVLRSYYWRNFVLFLFGLAHLFIFMWSGDILHTYGIAAMVAFLFRRCGPKTMLGIGLAMAVLQLVGGTIGIYVAQQTPAQIARIEAKQHAGLKLTKQETGKLEAAAKRKTERAKNKAEEAKRIALENRQRSNATGTFASWTAASWSATWFIWGVADSIGEGQFLEWLFVWEAAGTMLVGAALFRWGVIQGRRSSRFYMRTMLIGYLVGISCRAWQAYAMTRFIPDALPSFAFATGEVSRLAMTLGHVAAVYVLLGSGIGRRLLRPFEAAGRTALTVYVAQSIICLWVLYPPFALGLYGTQGWMALMLTALAVNAVLLWAANWYVRRYDIAPVEWAWRSIVAGRALPWRKRAKTGDIPVGGAIPAAG